MLLSLTHKDLHKQYHSSSQKLPKLHFSLQAEICHGVLQIKATKSGKQPFTERIEALGRSMYFVD